MSVSVSSFLTVSALIISRTECNNTLPAAGKGGRQWCIDGPYNHLSIATPRANFDFSKNVWWWWGPNRHSTVFWLLFYNGWHNFYLVLWSVVTQLCSDRLIGQNIETGLFSSFLQTSSMLWLSNRRIHDLLHKQMLSDHPTRNKQRRVYTYLFSN